MAENPRLSLIIPTINEEEIILHTLHSIAGVLGPLATETEVLIIDDGADDLPSRVGETPHSFRALTVYRNPERLGKGASIARGFGLSKGMVVGFIDADLSTSPHLIVEAHDSIIGGHDVYIASRDGGRRLHDRSFVKTLVARIFELGHRFLLFKGKRVFADTQCGFKFFKRATALDLYEDLVSRDGLADLEILVKAHKRGYRIAQRSVPRTNLRVGKRRLGAIFAGEAIDFCKIVFRYF